MSDPSARRPGPRRGPVAAAGLAAAGLLLVAGARPWWTGRLALPPPLPTRAVHSTGGPAAAVRALAVAALLGVVVVAAGRPALRRVVSLAVLVAGLAAAGLSLAAVAGPPPGDVPAARLGAWPAVAAAAGLALAAVAAVVAVRGGSWAGLGRRFDAAAGGAAPSGPGADPAATWDALDRGEDPTQR